MTVEIFNLPLLSTQQAGNTFRGLEKIDARFVVETLGQTCVLRLRTSYLFLASFKSSLIVPVEEYTCTQFFEENEKCDRISIRFAFPLTTVTLNRSADVTLDSLHGVYHGKRNTTEKTVKLEKESTEIDTDCGTAKLFEQYDFQKVEIRPQYPIRALVRMSRCSFDLECPEGDLERALELAQTEADKVLQLVSLVEQDRINWNSAEATLFSKDGKAIGYYTSYRWSSPSNPSYRPDHSTMRKARECFVEIYNAYRQQPPSEREIIEGAVQNFVLANCAGTIETKLTFWYSCLDYLTEKVYKKKTKPFSKRLVKVCDDVGVIIDDLLETEVIEHWRGNKESENTCFWFADARNRFIHHGLGNLLDEHYQVLDSVRNARALAERLILARLGISNHDLCLGTPSLR